jgi:NAD(P)-dependent dehydrogenase (short-subunit alcohol dehydrogenase family)
MGATLSYPSVTLKDKVAVVTGGNQGIGYSTAKGLAAMGSHVIIGCRSEERATQAIEKMKQEIAAADPDRGTINVEFLPLDLSSLESSKQFAQSLIDKGISINILILNAGMANAPFGQFVFNVWQHSHYNLLFIAKTGDGFEQIFQVNYLSHFLLTLQLLPVLKASAPDTRIISLSSAAYPRGVFNSNDVEGTASYSAFQSYCNTKLFSVMMMFSLQKRLAGSGVSVFSVDPGFVMPTN